MAVSMDSAVLSHGSSNCPTAALGASTPSTLPRPCTRHVLPTCSGLRQVVPASRSLSYTSSAIESQRRSVKGIVCQQKQETLTLAGEVNDKTWSKLVIESDKPVLVDFWAPWCGPCRMIAPIVDEIAEMYKGRVLCLKLNTDESPLTATEYGIRSIPTVMIFKGGAKKDTIIGAVPKAALVTAIEKHLER